MSDRTAYLSRLLGLFLLILAAAGAVRPALLTVTAAAIVESPALLLVCGMLTLLAGLAIVLGHSVWHGGAAITVTILGWITLLKGAALLVVPDTGWTGMLTALRYPAWYPVYLAAAAALGLYLTIAGFRRAAESSVRRMI